MDPSFNQPQPGAPSAGPTYSPGGLPSPSSAQPPLGPTMASQPYAMPGAVPATAPPSNIYAPQERAGVAQPGAVQKPHLAPKSNPNSSQNSLQMAEVRDGIVIMNDGSFRSVIMVKSINFDLMSPEEREAVEFSYQGFLNSLYFPIQISVRSQKVDLGPYIEKLDKIRTEHDNMLLALLMEDYINYMGQISLQTNIMDKKFYVIIPYFPLVDVQATINASKGLISGISTMFSSKPKNQITINEADLVKAKDELRNRVQAVLGGLMQCGIQGLPLDTQELIELYYDSYNPDTATRQQLKNFNDLSVPVVTQGQGEAPRPELDREMQ
ncbi:MAG: hypothetical protein QG628_1044 [Patescibacteria group bacterium]|nr:hypothetical protein [Patescibacteria group bacterium]